MSWQCRYCDRPAGYMGIPIKVGDELICACGAEWEDAKILVEDVIEDYEDYDPWEEEILDDDDDYDDGTLDCGCCACCGCSCDDDGEW